MPIYAYATTFCLGLDGNRLPSAIVPVFLGIHCSDPLGALTYAKSSYGAPALCRDAPTAKAFQDVGFHNAVNYGCLSTLLPKRESDADAGKVFICEIDDTLRKCIPKEFENSIVEMDNQYVVFNSSVNNEKRGRISYDLMMKRINMLKKEASLVVSSRLHLILPCVAMGIPVVFAMKSRDERLGCLSRFVPVYSEHEYKDIDWHPRAVEIEDVKKQMLEIAIECLKYVRDSYDSRQRIIKKYELLSKTIDYKEKYHYHLMSPYRGYLNAKQLKAFTDDRRDTFFADLTGKTPQTTDVIFFGTGSMGANFYMNIFGVLKDCKSFSFMDNNPQLHGKKLFNVLIRKPSDLLEYDRENLVVFITMNGYVGGAAEQVANQLVRDYSLAEGIHYFLLEHVYSTAMQVWTHAKFYDIGYRDYDLIRSWNLLHESKLHDK